MSYACFVGGSRMSMIEVWGVVKLFLLRERRLWLMVVRFRSLGCNSW